MYFDLPSRRRNERPKLLPLKVKLTPDAEWSFIDVDQEVYPFLVLLPLFRMPDDLSGYTTSGNRGAVAQRFWIRGASFRDGITRHLDILAAKLKVAAIEPQGSASVPEFIRMLAKIAHAFAVAELGLNAFSPLLMPIIRDDETSNCAQHIGGV
ncbi:MAG: hypothetical protein JO213_05995, partial [Alphaproteobacteria bacterium]|nr:hypothetical protein [Alphaproteobacteria bacterium]